MMNVQSKYVTLGSLEQFQSMILIRTPYFQMLLSKLNTTVIIVKIAHLRHQTNHKDDSLDFKRILATIL